MQSSTLEQAIISFFESVAKKDKNELIRLKQDNNFIIDHSHWYFSLPNLFLFLQHQNKIFKNVNYEQFRQSIFNSPINQTVKAYDVEITIIDNQSLVDKSIYALVWQE